jgi:maltooligosyltrehalose trehalohydrolase
MLFMGEEWAASRPFQFFTSHPEPELGRVTAEGRIAEFENMGWDPSMVPDPQDPLTFERSRLDWTELSGGRHARMLAVYRELTALRRSLPELTDSTFASVSATADEVTRVFTLRRGSVLIAVNFGAAPATLPTFGELIFTTPTAATTGPEGLVLPPHAGALVRLE